MDINEFIDKIREQYDEPTNGAVSLDTDFRAIEGWGSVVGLGIIIMIADEYGVEMSVDEFRAAKTIRDIYDFVLTHKDR